MSVSAPGSLARVITHPNQWPPAGVDGCYVVGSGSDRRFMQVRSTLVRGGIAALAAAAADLLGSAASSSVRSGIVDYCCSVLLSCLAVSGLLPRPPPS